MPAQTEDFWTFDCIPVIHGEETLFSWCSLYHRLSGATFAESTSRRLFNSSTGGFIRDFPGRLDYFVQVTRSLLGDADQIMDSHTLLRLYSKFRPAMAENEVRTMMRGASVGRLKFILGLPSSRANAHHPLKFCKRCAEEEVATQGFARWWVCNQWPTAWVCEKHGQLLDRARNGISKVSRIAWFLPSDLKQSEIEVAPRLPFNTLVRLASLARLTTAISDSGEERYTPEILRLTFLAGIKHRGWVSANGHVKYEVVRDVILDECDGLEQLHGLEFIQSLHQPSFGFLGTALRGGNRYLHPSKYLLMIHFLFEKFETFVETYAKYSGVSDVSGTRKLILDPDRTCRDEKMRSMILDENRSLNQVAGLMDLSVASVVAWAKQNEIQFERRPRLETERLLDEIRRLILEGASRQEMAAKLCVRRRWLITFFARHPDLYAEWQRNHHAALLQIRRTAFRKFISTHQGIPLGKLLAIPANGYKWLLKHDRQWLADNMPQVCS